MILGVRMVWIMSETLFDDWLEKAKEAEAEKAREKRKAHPKGQMCRGCVHFMRHQFTDKINYCTAVRNPRSGSGYGKTTRTGWCAKWEERK